MILSKIIITADIDNKQEILEILFSVKLRTEGEPQCLSCCIYQEPRNEELITYEEVWKTEESLRRHIRSPIYRNLLAAMDLSSECPEVKFYMNSRLEDIELIKKVMGFAKEEGV